MSRSATQLLAAQHGIEARPGAKVECPFCKHHTLSIKRDDTLARCFHPTCGQYITPLGGDSVPASGLFAALEGIGRDFHRALLALADQRGQHAHRYLIEERGVHWRVIVDAPVGVVPKGYDVMAAFAPTIAEVETALRAEEQAASDSGSKKKKQPGHGARERLNGLVDARDKLKDLIEPLHGWLALIYTDTAHRTVAIRFRKPYSKKIVMFKPTEVGGAFGHGVFGSDGSVNTLDSGDPLLVVEGEFNWLQLQSLCARVVEAKGKPPESSYVFSCAVGGVSNADLQTLLGLCRNPVICYDNDTSGAGFALVENIRRRATVTAFTTPQCDSDLDSYLREFRSDCSAALTAVRDLVASRTVFTRPYEALRSEIDGLRTVEGGKGGLKRFQVHRRAGEIVIADLKDRGTYYNDGARAFFFHGEDKHLIAVETDALVLELLLGRYGLAPGEEIFRHIRDAMRLEALEHGTKTAVYALSHYDAESHTLYLSDLDRRIYRIRPDGIEHVEVGTDGVLFLHDPSLKPFKVGEPDPTRSALDDLVLGSPHFKEGALDAGEQRIVLMMWFFAIFFPELFPTRPILALIGERGSGKSSLLRRIGRLLFGPSFDVMALTDDPKDFDAAVTNSQLVAVDNADKTVPWLEDKLAVAATGGRIRKREFYTTNRMVEYPIQAFIAITSRTPYFRREDVADRTLLLQVPRLEQFRPEASLLAELDARRDEAITEVAGHLQEIVQALHAQRGQTYDTTFRMADFADFALKIAHAQGWAGAMEQILDRMSKEQTAFALEGEQIVELLEAWLTEGNGKNVGRQVTTADLHREFGTVASRLGVELRFKNALSVAQTLRHKGSALRELFEITEHKGSGRSRRLSFRPRSSPSMAPEAAEGQQVHAG